MPLRPRLLRGIALALAALLALAAPARAQPASAPASASSPGQPVSADELQQLVDTLDDPVARQKLVTQLQALIAAQRGQQQQSALASPATAFDTLSDQFDTMATEILSAAKVVINLPRLFRWLERQVESEPQRAFWLTVGTQLALILTAGLIANWVADFLLRRVQRKVAALRGATTGARLVNMLLGFVIAAVPVLAFAAASSATVPFVDVNFGTREVARVLIAAILWTRLVLAAVRVALLAPAAQESLRARRRDAPVSLYLGAALRRLGGLWLLVRLGGVVARRARRDLCAHPALDDPGAGDACHHLRAAEPHRGERLAARRTRGPRHAGA